MKYISRLHQLAFTAISIVLANCTTVDKTPKPLPVVPAPDIAISKKPLYQFVQWDELPGWTTNALQPGFIAWRNGCAVLKKQAIWSELCTKAQDIPNQERIIRQFIEMQFIPLKVSWSSGEDTGLVTGYYEPLLEGDLKKTSQARYPLYAPPADMITVQLSSLYPDLKNRPLRGRLVANKLLPYYSRAEIEQGKGKLEAIAWVNDPVELLFLQIQGAGRIKLPTGEMIRVGYADQNGHPFRAIGTWLIKQGEMPAWQASMQNIKAWAQANPERVTTLLNSDPSYVFFTRNDQVKGGPIGALQVSLTDGYSIAVDQNFIPLGSPIYLATQYPGAKQALQRLVAAQDTGGAIKGPMRIDFFWGFGNTSAELAGRMKSPGNIWILWPKYAPLPSSAKNS